MPDLNFDIYAMVSPKTEADYEALLDEALNQLDTLDQIMAGIYDQSNPKSP